MPNIRFLIWLLYFLFSLSTEAHFCERRWIIFYPLFFIFYFLISPPDNKNIINKILCILAYLEYKYCSASLLYMSHNIHILFIYYKKNKHKISLVFMNIIILSINLYFYCVLLEFLQKPLPHHFYEYRTNNQFSLGSLQHL